MTTKAQVIKRLETLVNKAEELRQIDDFESFCLYPTVNLQTFINDCLSAIYQLQSRP